MSEQITNPIIVPTMDPIINFTEYYKLCQNDLLTKFKTNLTNSKYYGKYGVEIKTLQKDNLLFTKFKYDDNCRFSYPWQIASRGTTIIKNKDKLVPIFGLNKFFNLHEFEKNYNIRFEEFLLHLQNQGFKFVLMPKHDGSYVQCFTDETGTKHRHTLGSLEKNRIGKSLLTYHYITNKLLYNQFSALYDFLDRNIGFSLVCEIITPHNVIKTVYDFTDNPDGILKPIVMIRPDGIPTFDNMWDYIENKWEFTYENFNEIKDQALRQIESDSATFGILPEGLVVYCYKEEKNDKNKINNICFPIAKIKRSEYVKFDETENLSILCKLQIAKIEGKIDDIPLTESQQTHIDEFTKYLNKIAEIFNKLELLTNMQNLNSKQYTEHIKNLPNILQIYADPLFKLRKNGFEFVSGYDAIIKVLNLQFQLETNNPCHDKVIYNFQLKYGYEWFKKTKYD